MVQRVTTEVLCDLDGHGAKGAEIVTITVGGAAVEIDLCEVHRRELEDLLDPYFEQGRRIGRGRRTTSPATRTSPKAKAAAKTAADDKADRADIRRWAQQQGYEVGDRGRLAQGLVEAYRAAH